MMKNQKRPWTQNQRFEFIEWKLFWEGHLNRKDLETQFDISTPQASVDLKRYRELADGNIEYDGTEKSFVPSSKLVPNFLKPSADRLLLQLRALLSSALSRRDLWFRSLPAVDMVPDLVRHVDPECLRKVLQALRTRSAVDVEYQSLTNSRWRRIAPHALAFDGHRWHLRAWACDREDFRDFVLSRIDSIGELHEVEYDPEDDVAWNRKVLLQLCPHPGLTPEQRLAIQRDYDMSEGQRDIELRLSMAYYFIKRMNLDLPDLPAARVQLCIANLAEVDAAIERAKKDGAERIAMRLRSVTGQHPLGQP
ncbi:WYL domain-containing protein [Mesorhizobium sp. GR13]|uniref:WYL domain-containing protein n=1 Tax=Mesorhizobium sp. GR13 TaxID=2562308 RepID=UPI0010C07356|nr:WYL domain-containing protein [Mesorhizobium sp. GR13]